MHGPVCSTAQINWVPMHKINCVLVCVLIGYSCVNLLDADAEVTGVLMHELTSPSCIKYHNAPGRTPHTPCN